MALICSVCLADGPNFKMNRHALLEIMVEARNVRATLAVPDMVGTFFSMFI